jgi:hypothetical protein
MPVAVEAYSIRRFAKPLYGLTPVSGVRIPPPPPFSLDCRESRLHGSKNCRKSPQFRNFRAHTGPEKMSRWNSRESILAFFSEGHCGSPVSSTPPGECNAITNRWCGERDLTSLVLGPFYSVLRPWLKAEGVTTEALLGPPQCSASQCPLFHQYKEDRHENQDVDCGGNHSPHNRSGNWLHHVGTDSALK